MKSLAVCISGHLQIKKGRINPLQGIKSFKKNFSKDFNITYFISLTYDENNKKLYYDFLDELYPKVVLELSENEIPEFNLNKNRVRPETINIKNIYLMFWKMKISNELRKNFELENNKNFDYIIRMRPDLYFEKGVSKYNLFLFKLGLKKIYVPYFPYNFSKIAVADFFAFGKREDMDYYNNCYNFLENIYSTGIEFHPEMMLGYYLRLKMRISKEKTICYLSNNKNKNGYW